MEFKKIAWCVALWMGAAFAVTAQEVSAQENEAPQVLTSDLALRQVVTSEKLTVNFVIVDDDKITKITIDGEPQSFTPEDTVLLVKEFTFTRGRRVIKVVVEDEKGNKRERTYLVAFGVPLEVETPEKKEEKKEAALRINYVVEGGYEVDSNPTQDFSLPFGLSVGGISPTGVVPDDEQEDNRIVLNGLVALSGGGWSAYGGAAIIDYSEEKNKPVESSVFFFGGSWNPAEGDGFRLGANYTDISLGGNAYSTLLGVSPATESTTRDEDGTHRSLYGVDLTSKSFDSSDQEAGIELTLKWVGNSLDKENQDSSKKTFAIGNRTEGSSDTEFVFLKWEGDWKNRWESGFRWDIGFGYEFRNYPNVTDVIVGSTRLDNIIRFSTGLGWEFTPTLSALFNYRFTTDLSNEKPYERTIYGVTVKGSF